jgi:hypothetical protein
MRRPGTRPLTVLGLALGGVVAGHALTYLVIRPDARQRTDLLAATGHSYLHPVAGVLLTCAAVALVAFVIGRLIEGRSSSRRLSRDLVTLQVAAFVGMEIAERVAAGAPLSDLARILPLGIAIQVVIAIAIGALLHRLARGLESAIAAVTARPRFDRSAAEALTVPSFAWSGSPPILAAKGRAPPRPR